MKNGENPLFFQCYTQLPFFSFCTEFTMLQSLSFSGLSYNLPNGKSTVFLQKRKSYQQSYTQDVDNIIWFLKKSKYTFSVENFL